MNDTKLDLSWLLQQIAAIQSDTDYLHAAIQQLAEMGLGDSGEAGSPGNVMGQAKAEALGDIVRCRETTNQQLLDIYKRIYVEQFTRPAEEA